MSLKYEPSSEPLHISELALRDSARDLFLVAGSNRPFQARDLCWRSQILVQIKALSKSGLGAAGCHMSELPLHDSARDLLFMAETRTAEALLNKRLDRLVPSPGKGRVLSREGACLGGNGLVLSCLQTRTAEALLNKRLDRLVPKPLRRNRSATRNRRLRLFSRCSQFTPTGHVPGGGREYRWTPR